MVVADTYDSHLSEYIGSLKICGAGEDFQSKGINGKDAKFKVVRVHSNPLDLATATENNYDVVMQGKKVVKIEFVGSSRTSSIVTLEMPNRERVCMQCVLNKFDASFYSDDESDQY